MDRQKVIKELRKHNDGAGVLNKTQIAEFLQDRTGDRRKVNRLVKGLMAFEGKYYLISDVADAFVSGSR